MSAQNRQRAAQGAEPKRWMVGVAHESDGHQALHSPAHDPALDEEDADMLLDQVFMHMHTHTHADGTVHNHLHAHPGGNEPHTHGEQEEHSHAAAAQGATVLSAHGVAYSYPRMDQPVFSSIDFAAATGQVVGILGNNGAGKSTLLSVLAGMRAPSRGQVEVAGGNIQAMSRREVARHIAFVAQQQKAPHLRVYDEVLLGRKPHITWSVSEYDRVVVAEVIERMGLEPYVSRHVDELSGGERQKVYLARALAQEPEVLLLDEPTSALDLRNQVEVLQAMRDVTTAGSLATVIVIHDVNLALRFCDRFVIMRDGKIIAEGGHEAITASALSQAYGIGIQLGEVAGETVVVPGHVH